MFDSADFCWSQIRFFLPAIPYAAKYKESFNQRGRERERERFFIRIAWSYEIALILYRKASLETAMLWAISMMPNYIRFEIHWMDNSRVNYWTRAFFSTVTPWIDGVSQQFGLAYCFWIPKPVKYKDRRQGTDVL